MKCVTNVCSLPEKVYDCLLNEVHSSPISTVLHQTLGQGQLALPKTFRDQKCLMKAQIHTSELGHTDIKRIPLRAGT